MNNLDFGIIGNCRSAALISKKGAIDWCCLPEFDSSSIFASLLDEEKGGSFKIICDNNYAIHQEYLENTGILVTTFSNGEDTFEVRDFMPLYSKDNKTSYTPPEIIRYIKYKCGKPVFKVYYDPKLEYAIDETVTYVKTNFIISLTDTKKFDSIFLYSNFDKQKIVNSEPIVLEHDGYFLFGYNEKIFEQNIEKIHLEYERTKVYWLDWIEKIPSYQKYNHEIRRSAITLKMLTYEKTGAVLAAVTTSLPETIGEVRNWDYRFCWIRDASMVINVLSLLGHKKMAKKYLEFVIDIIPDKDEKLQIMYGINKEKKLT
jgi:GH15 family glucan-1,4-alpha-glucosidase